MDEIKNEVKKDYKALGLIDPEVGEELYPTVLVYDYLKDGKLVKGKFNYHEAVNSAYKKIQKQLEVQIQQALLHGVQEE